MFNPKAVNPNFVLIRIDREKQKAKREKIGSIYIPPALIHMQYNQQIGEVVLVGDNIRTMMPHMEAGDRLFFHHAVEGNVPNEFDKESGKKQFVPVISYCVYDNHYEDPFVYYVVRDTFIYGHIKSTGEVYMHPDIILGIPAKEEEDNRNVEKKGGLFLFVNYKEERADIEKRIAALKQEAETHPKRAAELMMEMEKLTRSLNKKRSGKFLPLFVAESLEKEAGTSITANDVMYYEFIGSKSTVPQVTTIQIDGTHFYVLRKNYALGIKPLADMANMEY